MCTSLKKLYLFEQNTATGLFKKRITNGNLSAIEFLRIESCHQLKGLFSPHSCKCLMNLNVLRVKDCSNLQEVISKEENIRQTKVDEIKFPWLRRLELLELGSIVAFCCSNFDLVFPSLELVKMINCPMNGETFSGGCLSVPNLTLDSILVNWPFFSKEVYYAF